MDFIKKVKRYVFGEVSNPHCKDWDCSQQSAGIARRRPFSPHCLFIMQHKA